MDLRLMRNVPSKHSEGQAEGCAGSVQLWLPLSLASVLGYGLGFGSLAASGVFLLPPVHACRPAKVS